MKGIFYTAISFLILSSVIVYIYFVSLTNVERSDVITRELGAQRVYYIWRSVHDNIGNVLNITTAKENDTAIFNDTLPSENDVKSLLNALQTFTNNIYQDDTIRIRFEDTSGNEVNLSETLKPVIQIKPMNINYSWPNFGKNRLFIKVDPTNFSFIKKIDIYIKIKNAYFDCDYNFGTPSKADDCNKWAPDNTVPNCSGIEYCLELNLTFNDSNNAVFNFPEKFFNIDDSPPKKSTNNLDLENSTSNFFIKTEVGPLSTVIDIDLQNVKVDSTVKIKLNTTDFFINYPAKLNVTSDFAKRLDWL